MNDELNELVAAHRADIYRAPPRAVDQWHSVIDQAAALERGREPMPESRWRPGSFFWGVAVTAALAIGIGIGLLFSANDGSSPAGQATLVVSATPDSSLPPGALSRGLQVHLRDSRDQLANLGTNADKAMLILQIIEQNRMYEIAADRSDAPNLARVLRAFEPILLELAAADIAPADADALRAQLAFELNVMLTKLARQASDGTHTT